MLVLLLCFRYFRSLVISSEPGSGSGGAHLTLTLSLPPAAHLEQLEPLMVRGKQWLAGDAMTH
jgi:hypothetical protein